MPSSSPAISVLQKMVQQRDVFVRVHDDTAAAAASAAARATRSSTAAEEGEAELRGAGASPPVVGIVTHVRFQASTFQ